MGIKNIQFRTTVFENESRYHGVYFDPQDKMSVINQFLITYPNWSSVNNLVSDLLLAEKLEPHTPKHIGKDESHIYADREKVVFDNRLITEMEPVTLTLKDTIRLFTLYGSYLERYENCRIRGLQPISKTKLPNHW